MAIITYVHIDSDIVKKLMAVKYMAHIKFIDKELYLKALSLGFEPEEWKAKNNMEIFY